eukprot:621699-Pyramimonas_sp.AAC.1
MKDNSAQDLNQSSTGELDASKSLQTPNVLFLHFGRYEWKGKKTPRKLHSSTLEEHHERPSIMSVYAAKHTYLSSPLAMQMPWRWLLSLLRIADTGLALTAGIFRSLST